MKYPLPLLFGLWALFILAGSFWYSNSACCTGTIATGTTMVEKTTPAVAATSPVTEETTAITPTEEIVTTSSEEITLSTIEERLRASSLLLYFDADSEELNLEEKQKNYLQDLYTYAEENEYATILVAGHTDSEGDSKYNLDISRKKADFVKNYLVVNGIRPEQIETVGIGADEPIATNDTEEGRSTNRRVEIILR